MHDDNEIVAEAEGYRLCLWRDEDPMSPRDADNLGIMWTRHRNYSLGDEPYRKGIEEYDAVDDFAQHSPDWSPLAIVKHLVRAYGATVVLPLYLYDHSGLSISAGNNLVPEMLEARTRGLGVDTERNRAFALDAGGWDTSVVGYIFDTAKQREKIGTPLELVEQCLRSEVRVYDQYLTGDVWGYSVEHKVTVYETRIVDRGGFDNSVSSTVSEDWEVIGLCAGFFGQDDAKTEGLAKMAAYVREGVVG